MFKFLYSCFAWFFLACCFIFHFLFSVIFMWFFKDSAWANMRLSKIFIGAGFTILGIKVVIKGLENIPRDQNFILMCNHQSLLDILIILKIMPVRFSFIAKKQLLQVPILGWDIALQGHFPIDRANPRAATATLEKIKEKVLAGRSLLFFPEGTRSVNRTINQFKRGGFIIAQETATQIIPVCIDGANQVIRKHSIVIHPGKVVVSFGKPILVKQLDPESDVGRLYTKEIIELTRNQVVAMQSGISA